MIVTIFGDVHGNLIALEKMLNIEKNHTDLFISHGDVVNYGPWSNECVELLDSIPNCIKLKGNHEQYYQKSCYGGENEVAKAFFSKCIIDFKPKNLLVINKYLEEIQLQEFTIQHTLFDQYIFANTDLEGLSINSNYIIGHSHQQFERQLNNFSIINTGSLGQNREFINQSCYLTLDTETKKVTLKQFIHNIDFVIKEMETQKYPRICIEYYKSKKQI